MEMILNDPAACHARFADFLSRYWACCLSHLWPRLEGYFQRDIASRGRILFQEDVAAVFADLSADVHVEAGGERVVIYRPGSADDGSDYEMTFAESEQILLSPSYFIWPHLPVHTIRMGDVTRVNATAITYSVQEIQDEVQAPVPPQKLLDLLRAIGDMTRLQILQLLSEKSRATSEVATLIGISEAAVSKHLKQLQRAGWVVSKRQSYYVIYSVERGPLIDLMAGIEQILDGRRG